MSRSGGDTTVLQQEHCPGVPESTRWLQAISTEVVAGRNSRTEVASASAVRPTEHKVEPVVKEPEEEPEPIGRVARAKLLFVRRGSNRGRSRLVPRGFQEE